MSKVQELSPGTFNHLGFGGRTRGVCEKEQSLRREMRDVVVREGPKSQMKSVSRRTKELCQRLIAKIG